MKRLISLIIAIICIGVLFSACKKEPAEQIEQTENTYIEGTDYQYMYDNHPMAESPDGYYFLAGYYLYYIDKANMEAIPLCNKPNCLHQNETNPEKVLDCNACFLNSGSSPLVAWYEGHLYVTDQKTNGNANGEYDLIRMDADGSNRKTLLALPANTSCYMIHRGYIYYASIVYSEDLDSTYGVFRIPLAGGKEETIYAGKDPGDGRRGTIDRLLAYGNTVYIVMHISDFNQNTREDTVYGYDTIAGNVWNIFNNDTLVSTMSPVFLDGKIYEALYHVNDLADPADEYYEHIVTNLDGSDPQPVSFFSDDSTMTYRSDLTSFWYYTIPWYQTSGEKPLLQRLDTSGKVIGEVVDPKFSGSSSTYIMPGGVEYAFIMNEEQGEDGETDYVLYWIDKNSPDGKYIQNECLRIPRSSWFKSIVTSTR